MQVITRDDRIVDFNIERIYNAIDKAFRDVERTTIPEDLKEKVEDWFFTNYDIDHVFTIEEIQDIVEDILMREQYYAVAKGYIIYRNEHAENRVLRERIEYMDEYGRTNANAATASETDANANVAVKNVANLNGEVWKSQNRKIQRLRMRKKLKELYPDLEQQYEKDLAHHIIYAHDESSFPVVTYYTYGPKEVVYAKLNDEPILASLETIYKMCKQREVMHEQDNVWCKYPQNLYVYDRGGFTKVTVLTRKRRHRPLVIVKTSFGENVVVTDNHPMIVSDDKNNTVEAMDCKEKQQYRCSPAKDMKFENIEEVDLTLCVDYDRAFSNYITTHNIQSPYYFAKRYVKMNRDLGYIIGFFIGDGNYVNTSDNIDFSQKDQRILNHLSEMIFESFGVVSFVEYNKKNDMYFLRVKSKIVTDFFRNFLNIKDKAQHKCLPTNILSFTEDFAAGIIEGLIDSDGTIKADSEIMIRLSSRECIQQLTMLLRYFGYGVANSVQSTPFGNNRAYKTNYTIWGVIFTNSVNCKKFDKSIKWQEKIKHEVDKWLKYSDNTWVNVLNVKTIGECSFLDQCEFIYDITTESNTLVCNNLWMHNCKAVSMWPFFLHGSSDMDGLGTKPPTNLQSFCGQLGNLVFLHSAQCKGAVAYGEFFNAVDYYCTKDWGTEYHKKMEDVVMTEPCRTRRQMLHQYFQQIVYTINQPAGNRCYQSPFTNFSYFDKNYWHAVFEDFTFPDGTRPEWERVSFLQKEFMQWLNKERTHTLLTFPVETMALLSDGKDIIDKEYKEFTAKMYSEGHSFFTYISDNPDSLASCCRLRNQIQENVFSFTNGLTGVQTGSANVITLNMSRIMQDWARENEYSRQWLALHFLEDKPKESFKKYLEAILERVYAYQITYKTMLYEVEANGLLTASNAGYISMRKLYSTIGINGINEAAEFIGMRCNYNEPYKQFCRLVTGTISAQNRLHSKDPKFQFNCEFVPAEGLSSKNYNWDKEDGYWVPDNRVLYNSYFYLADDPKTNVLEKFKLHGREFTELLDGGVGLHCNLAEHLSQKQYEMLIDIAIKDGTSYFTFNIPNSECTNPECHHIIKQPLDICPKCGSRMRQWTRVIGYLRPVDNFDQYRKIEAEHRYYAPGTGN